MPLQPSHHANSTLIGRFHLMNDFLQTSFREISGISGQTFFTGEGKKRPNHKCPLACKCCTSDDPCRMSNLRSSDFDTNSFSPTSFIFLCSQRRAKTQHSSIHSGERRPSIPLGISGQTFFTGEGKKGQTTCPLACKCCTSDDPCRMSIPTILWYPIYHLQVSPTVPLIMILTHICLREFIHMTILVHIVHLILVHIHICLKEYILMTIHIHTVHIHMCVKLTIPVRCSTLASFHRMLNCLSHL